MNHLEKLEVVRQAVMKENPKIGEWMEGMEYFLDRINFAGSCIDAKAATFMNNDLTYRFNLQDVLHAVEKKILGDWQNISPEETKPTRAALRVLQYWDLSKTLEDQDEPTISFLHEILI